MDDFFDQGFAIGNGLTDPGIQYKAYTQYAVDMKLITQSDADNLSPLVPRCDQAIKLCGNSYCLSHLTKLLPIDPSQSSFLLCFKSFF